MGWQAPPGLLQLPSPEDPSGSFYTSCGSGEGSDPDGAPSFASVLFVNGFKGGVTKGRVCTRPFVFAQEQRRVSGLPKALKKRAPHATGRCVSYTGTYPDHLNWIAFHYKHVSVLAVADSFTPDRLTAWAGQICR